MLKNEFIRFIITGGIAAFINLVSRYLLNFIIPFESAIVVAYLLGMLTAYLLAKIFVFEHSGRGVSSELFRFTVINIIALIQVWAVSVGLARLFFPAINFTWHPEDIAHIIGVASPIITSYLGHRYYSFRPNQP